MESTRTIACHLQALIKRTVHEEKERAYAKSKKLKKTLLEVKPDYFNDLVWAGMVEFWNSEDHVKRSQIAVDNRKKVTTLHSAGARSFQEVEKVTFKFISSKLILVRVFLCIVINYALIIVIIR